MKGQVLSISVLAITAAEIAAGLWYIKFNIYRTKGNISWRTWFKCIWVYGGLKRRYTELE